MGRVGGLMFDNGWKSAALADGKGAHSFRFVCDLVLAFVLVLSRSGDAKPISKNWEIFHLRWICELGYCLSKGQ